MPLWWESILGVKVEAVQGKQVPLEWTETYGGLWEWWHDPGVPLAFPVESASSRDATGSVALLLLLWRKAHVHAPIGDEDLLPWEDSRSTPRSMSALERNPQVSARIPHKV